MEEKSRILKKLNEDLTRPVSFNESFGGSENQMRLLLKNLPDDCFKDINLILNNTNHELIEKDKINVLWMHHFVNQKEAENLSSKDFINKIDWIVYNSNWNFEKHVYQFKVPENKCVVIKNAIEKIKFEEKPKDKINLIYHTTPWRGLVHLLKIFKKLKLNNLELHVCSSTKIYGKKFDNALGKNYEEIFEECKNTKNVNYHGFLDNKKTSDVITNAFHDYYDCDKLINNLNASLDVLEKEKSSNTVKGELIKSLFITSTMGVSYKLKLSKNI